MKALDEVKKEVEELEKQAQKAEGKIRHASTPSDCPFKIGEAYLIRTVTYFATGRVKEVVGHFLVLEEAAWIADTGTFVPAIREFELINEMILNLNFIMNAFPWTHKLPREQK